MFDLPKVSRSDLKKIAKSKLGEAKRGLSAAKTFLAIQGHLAKDELEENFLGPNVAAAIRKYQHEFGLQVTGELDDATVDAMATPRCGQRDHSLSLSQECRWDQAVLRYAFENLPDELESTVTRLAIGRAFATWQSVCPLEFEEVDHNAAHDISIGWRPAQDSDYDLVGTDIAHADYPGDCSEVNPGGVKPIHFDATECRWVDNPDWQRDNSVDIADYDLETVALHEIGHIIGLKHSFNPEAVLYGNVPAQARRTLSDEDVMRVENLYSNP